MNTNKTGSEHPAGSSHWQLISSESLSIRCFFLNFKFELQFISNNEQVGIYIGDCSMFWEMKLKEAFQQN